MDISDDSFKMIYEDYEDSGSSEYEKSRHDVYQLQGLQWKMVITTLKVHYQVQYVTIKVLSKYLKVRTSMQQKYSLTCASLDLKQSSLISGFHWFHFLARSPFSDIRKILQLKSYK